MIKINESGYIYIDNNQVSQFKDECFEYNGCKYIYKRTFLGLKVDLIKDGTIIARVRSSLSPFRYSKIVLYNNCRYKLKRGIFTKEYMLHDIDNMVIGKIKPDGLMSRTPITSIINEIPVEVQIFISICIQENWSDAGGPA